MYPLEVRVWTAVRQDLTASRKNVFEKSSGASHHNLQTSGGQLGPISNVFVGLVPTPDVGTSSW